MGYHSSQMAISETARQANLLYPSSGLRQADIVAEAYASRNKRNIGISQMVYGLIQVINLEQIEATFEKLEINFNDFLIYIEFVGESELALPNTEGEQNPNHTPHLRQALIIANSLAGREGKSEIGAEDMMGGIAIYAKEQYGKQTSNETPQDIDEIIRENEAAD